MKLIASVLLFAFAWGAIAQTTPIVIPVPVSAVAQSVAPAIAAAPAVVAQSGIMAWITAHLGSQAAILLLVSSFLSILSAVRQVLYVYDGVAPGADIPANMVGLTWVNKICLITGKVVDYLTGNVAH